MKISRRAKRMQRQHQRRSTHATLSLTALIDIFTILCFFILVGASDVEVLQTSAAVNLPAAAALQKPRTTAVITVNNDEIFVQGQRIASIKDNADSDIIPELKAELEALSQASFLTPSSADGEAITTPDREVTIMGDKQIPFKLLRRIMATCSEAKYLNISLAVVER